MLLLNQQTTTDALNIRDQPQRQHNPSLSSSPNHRHQTRYRHCLALAFRLVLNAQLSALSLTNLLFLHTFVLRCARAVPPKQRRCQMLTWLLLSKCGDQCQCQYASSPLREFQMVSPLVLPHQRSPQRVFVCKEALLPRLCALPSEPDNQSSYRCDRLNSLYQSLSRQRA